MKFDNLLLLIPLTLPLLHLVAAGCNATKIRWQMSLRLSAIAVTVAIAGAAAVLFMQPTAMPVNVLSPSAVSHLLAVLVSVLGLIIVKFSRNYLDGDENAGYFFITLHLTLAAVSVVVLTDHLLVLVGGWVGISLALNELLLLYPDRPRAVLAAHKKFLFARVAEIALFVAALLLFSQHGTWQISEIVTAYPAELSQKEQVAAILLALVALIKCAQLPMHGWLIQVVEAPTPVSALLHAGIINLGGYLLIMFAPLMVAANIANWLLLVVAGLTMTLASLIMSTRVSIKVKLAWSTCAQMGLMLVECALGLYELALLHLIAHAFYKAYRFLRSGSEVQNYLLQRSSALPKPVSAKTLIAMLAIALGGLTGAVWLMPTQALSIWILLFTFIAMLAVGSGVSAGGALLTRSISLAVFLFLAYLAQKYALLNVMSTGSFAHMSWQADLLLSFFILATFATWWWLRSSPSNPSAQRLRKWLFAGLYLDEWFTRTTLRVWPVRMPFRLANKRLPALNEEMK